MILTMAYYYTSVNIYHKIKLILEQTNNKKQRKYIFKDKKDIYFTVICTMSQTAQY